MFDLSAVGPDWLSVIKPIAEHQTWQQLENFLTEERKRELVFPAESDVFKALAETPLPEVKVVIVGQDPYHGIDQADGLAFSVRSPSKKPPSLKNILTELQNDLGLGVMSSGNLTSWARQGVLLLNSVLTVRAHAPGSHRKKGWESVTDSMLSAVSAQEKPIVFVLWGEYAGHKELLLDKSRHLVVKSPHPSPLSAYKGFFDSKPFSKVNKFLVDSALTPIDWHLTDV